MIGTRDDLDLDWDQVYAEAARTGTALEINGSPHRLDLAVERARRAVADGCLLSIDSDAHQTARARLRPLGHQPGAAGLGRAANVLNTRDREPRCSRWVAGKPERREPDGRVPSRVRWTMRDRPPDATSRSSRS